MTAKDLFKTSPGPPIGCPPANDILPDLTGFSWAGSQVPPRTPSKRSGEEFVAIWRGLDGLLESLPGPTPNMEKQFRANRKKVSNDAAKIRPRAKRGSRSRT
ncbi:hypothetical protein pipiens_016938 [Culex pipiens pipiens]|uniref:Uncharacterized protein n=1 Tax=Culex pipiens pipiens TaxID=38569 RepID=A0ABD1CJ02_CULPP